MAKLYASEIAVKVADDCVQIHGGYGFVKDYPAEKYFRDVKLTTIGEGTSEISGSSSRVNCCRAHDRWTSLNARVCSKAI